jgi:cytochrome P450
MIVSANRVALQPITLKDGTHIPVGTRLACANVDILNATLENPVAYDAFRWYRKRHETGQLNKYCAGQTEKHNLHFGYGNQACPGRHFAVGEIKLVMKRLLSEFEFKFPDGKGRPKNFYADEKIFPDPRAKLMMRKRRIPCGKCGRTD